MARTRKNVANLAPGDPTLEWYEKAIAALQAKPIADPTSWRYQAAIHDYFEGSDPLADPADVLPSAAERRKYWKKCQHGSWFFLPWHRMYLHHFEQMCLAEIVNRGGPGSWALPYWNYSASASAALLPEAFRNPTLPGGGTNHLHVVDRDPDANAGRAFADALDTDIARCLKEPDHAASTTGGSPGFGGPRRSHHGPGASGLVEATPHGNMHGRVGGNTGWMSAFHTAPLDPIFWLHHCNIDRLWEVWRARDANHLDPTTADWTAEAFDFHDARGNPITMRSDQVLDTTAAPLDYEYDDIRDPLAIPTTTIAGHVPAGPGGVVESVELRRGGAMAEMVGATSSFRLDRDVVEKAIKVTPTGPVTEAFHEMVARPSARTPAMRVFLHVEGIRSEKRSIPYDVYLNLPPGATPLNHPELRAGRLSMFGVVEASRSTEEHGDNGLHYTLEITDLYHRLAAEPGWSKDDLRVSLVPTRGDGPVGAEVGRLSLYFE